VRNGVMDFQGMGVLYRRPTPLGPLPFATAGDGHVYVVNGDSFHVSVVSPAGRVARTYIANVPRIATSKQDIVDVADELQQMANIQIKAVGIPDYATIIRNGPKSKFRAAIGAVIVSEQGSMLLQRPDVSESPYNRYVPGTRVVWAMSRQTFGQFPPAHRVPGQVVFGLLVVWYQRAG
jgi:hypothetical protein